MADNKPPAPPAPNMPPEANPVSPINVPRFDTATLIEYDEFTQRLKAIKDAAEKSITETKAFREEVVQAARDAKIKAGADLSAFREYLSDLSKEYSVLANTAEVQIRKIVEDNKLLSKEIEEGSKLIVDTTVKQALAYKELDEAQKKIYDSIVNQKNLNHDQKIEKINILLKEQKENTEKLAESEKKATEYRTKELLKQLDLRKEIFLQQEQEELENIKLKIKLGVSLTEQEEENISRIITRIDVQEKDKRGLEEIFKLEKARKEIHEQMSQESLRNHELEKVSKVLKIDQEVDKIDLANEKNEAQLKLNKLKELEYLASIPLIKMDRMRTDSLTDVNNKFSGYLDKLMPGSKESNIFGSAMLNIALSSGKAGDAIKNLKDSALAGLKESFLDPQKAAMMFANFLYDNVIKSTFELDKALASVNKSTGGFGKEFEQVAMKGSFIKTPDIANMANYGMKLSDVARVYGDLSKSIGGFNAMAESQRKVILESAASMELLGMSATTYGNLAGKFMGTTRASAEEASRMINQIAKDAVSLGKDVGQYAQDLNQALSSISGFAREATNIFKELSAISQATKGVISVADLTSLSAKFNTFDSAAESVSKLNAMLGGTSLSIMDMMQKDPSQQILEIKRAATEAGVSFDSLNIGYKRLLAEYFGGDMQKTAAFFNMQMSEANELINKSSASEEELAKKRERSVAAQEKLAATLDQFKMSLTPVVDILSGVLSGINSITNGIGVLPTMIGLGYLAFMRVRMAVTNIKTEAVNAATKFQEAFQASREPINILIGRIEKLVDVLGQSKMEVDKLKAGLDSAAASGQRLSTIAPQMGMATPGGGAVVPPPPAAGPRFGLGGAMSLLMAGSMLYTSFKDKETPTGGDIIAHFDPVTGKTTPIAESKDKSDKFVVEARNSNFTSEKVQNNYSESDTASSTSSSLTKSFAGSFLSSAFGAITQSMSSVTAPVNNFVSNAGDYLTNVKETIGNMSEPVTTFFKDAKSSVVETQRTSEKVTDLAERSSKELKDSAIQKEIVQRDAIANAISYNSSTSNISTSTVASNVNTKEQNKPTTLNLAVKFGNRTLDALTELVADQMHTTV